MQMKPRIYRRHPMKKHLGRATITEGASKQNSHPFKVMQKYKTLGFCMVSCISRLSYVYQSYWLCDRCDRAFMLKTSAAVSDVKA